jgi:hypothetical protein
MTPTPQQGRNLTRVLGQQFGQLMRVEPDAVARGATVYSQAIYGKVADVFCLAFGTFHEMD